MMEAPAGFKVVDERGSEFRLLSTAEFIGQFVAPDFIVDDVVQRGYVYSLTGRTGDGKTAILVLMASSLSSGQNFGGLAVEKGRVAFFAGENADDVRARIIMTAEAIGVPLDKLDIFFFDRPFDIVKARAEIEAEIERIGEFGLIIIDTLAAFFQGDEENSNVELGGFARDLRATLCTLPGKPAVIVAAHPTKNAGKSNLVPRGGGAFLAEVDGNLRLWSEDKETTELHWCGKLRGPGFEPINFRLHKRTSERVKDAKGRLIGSVVALPMNEDEIKAANQHARSDEDAVLDMLLNWPTESFADWCRRLNWLTGPDGTTPYKSRITRAIERLRDDKLVHTQRNRWKLTEKGRKEAEKVLKCWA